MKTLLLIGLLLASLLITTPPCATAVLTLGSATVSQGGTQSIQSVITNCGADKEKFRVTVTVTDAIGTITLLRNSQHMVNASQSINLGDTYNVPANSPLGTNRVMTLVFHTANGQTTEIARDEETFEVVP